MLVSGGRYVAGKRKVPHSEELCDLNGLNLTRCGNERVVRKCWYLVKAPTILPAGVQDKVEQFHLFMATSRQHRRCIIPQAVNIV